MGFSLSSRDRSFWGEETLKRDLKDGSFGAFLGLGQDPKNKKITNSSGPLGKFRHFERCKHFILKYSSKLDKQKTHQCKFSNSMIEHCLGSYLGCNVTSQSWQSCHTITVARAIEEEEQSKWRCFSSSEVV